MPALKVLTVCVGNICRSPVAERLLQSRLDAVAPGRVEVTSAGVRARDGDPMHELAAAELVRLGGDPAGFGSTYLDAGVLADVDLVLTMTTALRTKVLQAAPRLMRRTFTLTELAAICALEGAFPAGELDADTVLAEAGARRSAGVGAPDVDDPIGHAADTYRRVSDQISASVDAVVSVLGRLR